MSKVFIGEYAAPANGEWLDLELFTSTDDIEAEIVEIGKRCSWQGEEWLVSDSDCDGLDIAENPDFDEILQVLNFCEEDNVSPLAVQAWLNYGNDWDESRFQDSYNGQWDSELAFAEDYFDQAFTVPDELSNYIDYEAFRQELFMGDYFSSNDGEGGVFVFWSY